MRLRPSLGLSPRAAREPARSRDPGRRAAGGGARGRGARGLNPVVIREASTPDAAAIADLHVRAWQTAYRGIVPDAILDGFSIDARRDFWTRALTRAATDPADESRIWVVQEAGVVRGFAATRPSRDEDAVAGTGEVHSIYLAPEAWGRGLGTALLEHAAADLRARAFTPLVLWVIEANTRGRRFYERAGWRPDGARQPIDFDGVLVDEIRYMRL